MDHPCRAFGGICHCAKFGWNRCNSFDNIQVLIFNVFGLKMLIEAPNEVFLGILPTKESSHIVTPKRHLLVQKHVILRIGR